jgi:hypothetical protein
VYVVPRGVGLSASPSGEAGELADADGGAGCTDGRAVDVGSGLGSGLGAGVGSPDDAGCAVSSGAG